VLSEVGEVSVIERGDGRSRARGNSSAVGSARRWSRRSAGRFEMTPVRVRRRRVAGWRKSAGAVIVDRTSRWGNPFTVRCEPDRYLLRRVWCGVTPKVRRYWAANRLWL
jgi:hypothetical protein